MFLNVYSIRLGNVNDTLILENCMLVCILQPLFAVYRNELHKPAITNGMNSVAENS